MIRTDETRPDAFGVRIIWGLPLLAILSILVTMSERRFW